MMYSCLVLAGSIILVLHLEHGLDWGVVINLLECSPYGVYNLVVVGAEMGMCHSVDPIPERYFHGFFRCFWC